MQYAHIRNTKTNEKAVVPRHVLRHWKAKGWVEDSKPSPKPRETATETPEAPRSVTPESTTHDAKEND